MKEGERGKTKRAKQGESEEVVERTHAPDRPRASYPRLSFSPRFDLTLPQLFPLSPLYPFA